MRWHTQTQLRGSPWPLAPKHQILHLEKPQTACPASPQRPGKGKMLNILTVLGATWQGAECNLVWSEMEPSWVLCVAGWNVGWDLTECRMGPS